MVRNNKLIMTKKIYLLLIFFIGATVFFIHSCDFSSSYRRIEDQIPDTISYNFNVRPILSDKCYKCHGPDAAARKANLRLDIPEEAYRALKDNPGAHLIV